MWVTVMPIDSIVDGGELKSSGGWIASMLNSLVTIDSIKAIKILSVCNGKKMESQVGKVMFSQLQANNIISDYDDRLSTLIKKEISVFEPDIIDIQGTEFFLGNAVFQAVTNIPIVFTLQGLVSEIWKKYLNDLAVHDIIRQRSLRSIILRDTVVNRQKQYKRRGENEVFLLRNTKYVIGRTDWDRTHSLKINPSLEYFHCNRNLRQIFYEHQWDRNEINKFQLFTTQAHYPIKGLHILLEALYYLKREFPLVKLVVGGKSIVPRNLRERLLQSQYDLYLLKIIKKLGLQQNIQFTGWISAREVVSFLKKTHVFVCPSLMENSPNSVAEAQVIGVPTVASAVGGVPSYITDNHSGLLYNNNDSGLLANRIKQIFLSDSLAVRLSSNSRKECETRHDIGKNAARLFEIYTAILNK